MIRNLRVRSLLLAFTLALTAGCAGLPSGVSAIRGFEPERYLGVWYEIARLDHRFERGLIQISAEYSRREDGGLKVINRGFDPEEMRWQEAMGKAYFVETPDIGRLKVSFFGPFYGAYNIIDLDRENYRYSMVAGPDRDYLWILSRDPVLPQDILARLVKHVQDLGFATDKLIFRDGTQAPRL